MNKAIYQPIIILIVAILLCASCSNNNISKEELAVIDGIVLGQSFDSTYASYKKLNVPQDVFYTKRSYNDIYEIDSYLVSLSYSKVFDLSSYRNPSIKLSHLGILYPIQLIGTDKIIGMNVILVNTSEPFAFNPRDVNYLIGNNKCIQQDINELLIDEIIKIYNSKYGEPKSRIKTKNQEVYVLERNTVQKYSGTTDEGELITWENDIMTIKFFTGCQSYHSTFMKNPTQYIMHSTIGGEPQLPKIEYDQGIVGCYTFPYIQYYLKNSTINALGLDKKKI